MRKRANAVSNASIPRKVRGPPNRLPILRRNWSRRRHKLADADAYVVSIPKSGRTWLRFFLRHYLCSTEGVDDDWSGVEKMTEK